jgi:hypothetical protein
MILLWFVAGAALVAALLAWREARRNAKRLDDLSQMYWSLKYQYGELRVQAQRGATGGGPGAAPAPPVTPRDALIPLSSLKRSS